MAAPVIVIAVKSIAEKLIFDAFTNPEKIVKIIAIVLMVTVSFLLIFAMPAILAVSIPAILIDGNNMDPKIQIEQTEAVELYKQAPAIINNHAMEWVNQKVSEYSYADEIVTSIDLNLTWQMLVAIDTVRHEQDFKNIVEADILYLGDLFMDKTSHTEEYQIEVTMSEPRRDKDGKEYIYTWTESETKIRAVIIVQTYSIRHVMSLLSFNESQKVVVENIMNILFKNTGEI